MPMMCPCASNIPKKRGSKSMYIYLQLIICLPLLLACASISYCQPKYIQQSSLPNETISTTEVEEIKYDSLAYWDKLAIVRTELEQLMQAYESPLTDSPELDILIKQLCRTNKMLWSIEDEMRLEQDQINITVEVPIGELIDKITILQIKEKRIHEPIKLANIRKELSALLKTYDHYVIESKDLQELTHHLRKTNETLWDIEDAIRDKELYKKFDEEFIALARSVYYTNDERCRIKRAINELCGSRLIEEKSYRDYTLEIDNQS